LLYAQLNTGGRRFRHQSENGAGTWHRSAASDARHRREVMEYSYRNAVIAGRKMSLRVNRFFPMSEFPLMQEARQRRAFQQHCSENSWRLDWLADEAVHC
jgi:hypothetical protein